MQYVRSAGGAVSKAWNSINPATLSGAIDVIVVEHEDGSLACSPFHVRFGKLSLLRPYEKKVEFRVNNVKQDYAMKLGEGGEAFFVFETLGIVPEGLQTSPLVSPVASPTARPVSPIPDPSISELEPLDLDGSERRHAEQKAESNNATNVGSDGRLRADSAGATLSHSLPDDKFAAFPQSWEQKARPVSQGYDGSSIPTPERPPLEQARQTSSQSVPIPFSNPESSKDTAQRSPRSLPREEAVARATELSKKLWSSNIPSQVNDEGDLMLDMTGYKSSEEEALRAELAARQILLQDMEGDYNIGSLIGADENGNLMVYNSEEAKETATRKSAYPMMTSSSMRSTDALSDPGYHSEDTQSQVSLDIKNLERATSDSAVGLTTPPDSPKLADEPSKNFAKTLRLTSEQLKALNLKPGPNPMSFSVNRAICPANMYLWRHNAPIVISDIDGTITKSDALGHVLNYIGRDWTHLGVAKLYSDIVANGYNILYLTSRSVGQADTTRAYINGINQEGYKLPKGPVIMSPDRTIAALRREVYLRKPEVFKMACLRDIMGLFHTRQSPFYAGFGNRLTDALSYRSVNIPSTRIFTINSNSEVTLDLTSLNKYKTGYTSMREVVDQFFPPTGMLVQEGGEEYTDFNYWRDTPQDLDAISISTTSSDESYDSTMEDEEIDGEDDEEVLSDELADSYISTVAGSTEDLMRRSIESESRRRFAEVVTDGSSTMLAVRSADGSLEEELEITQSIEEDLQRRPSTYLDAMDEPQQT